MSRKITTFFVKYNYLLRFIMTLCIALYIPALFFGFTVIRHSYDEMLKGNEDYYRDTTASFVSYFDEQLDILKRHAFTLGFDGSISKKIDKDIIESHPYYCLMATKTLTDSKMALPNTIDLGIYFKNTDYIITASSKYTIDDFLSVYAGATLKQIQQMKSFFVKNTTKPIMLSTFAYKNYRDAKLFIGIPVTVNNQHEALIFYTLKYDSINSSFFGTQSSKDLRLCIFNPDGTLIYTNKTPEIEFIKNEDFLTFIADDNTPIFEYSNQENDYKLFKIHSPSVDKIFTSIVSQDQVEKNFKQFYKTMRNNTIFIAIGLILALILVIYINYKPILKLVRSVDQYNGLDVSSEISTISQAFNQMEESVSEQKIILMDYLVGNLIYGIPIPQADVEHLDPKLKSGNYCVLVILDLKLDTVGRGQLAEFILLNYNIYTYITDILYKNHIVLICVLEDDNMSNLTETVKQYLYSQYESIYKVGTGHVVHKLDDIHKSYMNALYTAKSTTINTDPSNTEFSIIEDYPSEDIIFFLQYVQNGQMDNALQTLDIIVERITDNIDTILLQKYICYDILIAYIKCLKQMRYPLSEKEIKNLLMCNSVSELHDSLSKSVKLACENLVHNDAYNPLRMGVLEYINENFTDPNISRTIVADNFDISVYSLSRLFKESVGIGFAEYITAKRMELSKQLLLTTDKSIAQIATEVGFNDPDYFGRVFKANYDLPPSQFRSQKKN